MLRGLRYWLIAGLFLAFSSVLSVRASAAVVRAVLFFSPTCGHCHQVMTEDLPPLHEKYGQQLQIIEVNVTQPEGQVLFQAAVQHFNLTRAGVPTLVIDEVVLRGSQEIPQRLPGLIEEYLAQGGTDWPAIPGLAEVIKTPTTLESADVNPSMLVRAWSNVMRDPIGNGLAIGVLFGMIGSVVVVVVRRAPIVRSQPAWRAWAIPALCLMGLVVAGYLAYVEAAHVEAVCGPVGDCNTVQQSEYARLFGFLSIGMLGLTGYTAILIAWGIERWGHAPLNRLAALALVLMTFGGTLFSLYLTFLEPFVIGATCAWCLTSAILMTALLWSTVTPRRLALLRGRLR
ncbi:MAG TPA: vitamin K epoxide reductase family protein [Anaerolineae bacterium]|nr:vitamin K epoxide reductase family protein [Anaerolineae bacterium]